MTSSSSTPPLLHQPPTVAAAVKVSSVAIHFLHCCLVHEQSQGSLPDRFSLNILQYRAGFRASFHYASE